MDKDRLIGTGEQMSGCEKQPVGKLVGDSKLQVDGKADQILGGAQNAAGGVNDTQKS